MNMNYKILSTCNREEEVNLLPFYKDSAESITYSGAANAAGVGKINNNNKSTTFMANGEWGTRGDYYVNLIRVLIQQGAL